MFPCAGIRRSRNLRPLVAGCAAVALACQPAAPPEPEPAAPAELPLAAEPVAVARSGGGTVPLPFDNLDAMAELQGIGVTPAPTIRLLAPQAGDVLSEPELTVRYEIENYWVGQEPDRPQQHVHVVLDDQPYKADYSPTGSVSFGADELAEGTHMLTVFLAREMHLSLKNPEASDRVVFHVGQPTEGWEGGLEQPTLIYSRPKGEYSIADGSAAALLLDFYLFNVTLAPGGHRVRVTVDGGEPRLVTRWQPHIVLREPPAGEHTVRLELIDGDGDPVPGPFNDTTRTVRVVE